MAPSKHMVTNFSSRPAARLTRAVRRAGAGGTLAMLLSGLLAVPGIALAQSSPDLSGAWQMSCPDRNAGARKVAIRIEQNGPTLTGSVSGPGRSGKLSGTVQGNQVSLTVAGRRRSMTLTGTTDGNSMTVHTPRGATCSVSRQ